MNIIFRACINKYNEQIACIDVLNGFSYVVFKFLLSENKNQIEISFSFYVL